MTADTPLPAARAWDLGPAPTGGHDRSLVASDGVRLRITVHPAGQRRAVLLHGLSQQRRFWDPVVRAMHGVSLITVDQRGHGDADKPSHGYDVARCAADVVAVLDRLGWDDACVVGHSWGAAVALQAAADHPGRVTSVVALDGGVLGPSELGPRDEVRRRLEPPRIAMPPDELLSLLRTGPLAPWWTPATAAALAPTFEIGDDGLARTRIGFERHMAVLDGLLDFRPDDVLPRISCSAWIVLCDPPRSQGPDSHDDDLGDPHDALAAAWEQARDRGWRRAADLLARPRVQRWGGALHDVPLQWPALVAGLIRAAVDEAPHASGGGGR